MKDQKPCFENAHFNCYVKGKNAIVEFKRQALLGSTLLDEKMELNNFLSAVEGDQDIICVTLVGNPEKRGIPEIAELLDKIKAEKNANFTIERINNAINDLISRILLSDKIFISVDSGNVTMPYLSLAAVCDYSIFADNSVFHKEYLEFGLIPKGGIIALLVERLGSRKALQVLLSSDEFTAEQAQELGLIDELVPYDALEQSYQRVVDKYSSIDDFMRIGLKRLTNYNSTIRPVFLEREDEVLKNLIKGVKPVKISSY